MTTRIMLAGAVLPLIAILFDTIPTSLDEAQEVFQSQTVVAGQYPELGEDQALDEAMNSGVFSYSGE